MGCFIAVPCPRPRHRRRQPPLRAAKARVLGCYDDTQTPGKRRGGEMCGGKYNFRVQVASVRVPSLLGQKRCDRCPTRLRGAGVREVAACGRRRGRGPSRLLVPAGGRWPGAPFRAWAQTLTTHRLHSRVMWPQGTQKRPQRRKTHAR